MGFTSRSHPLPSYLPPESSSPAVVVEPSTPTEPVKTDSEIEAEARTENLLRRSRGRFGTVLTGFRGFLNASDNNQSSGRKTLLGE